MQIRRVHAESGGRYGARKIYHQLRREAVLVDGTPIALLTVELGRAVARYGAPHYRVLHIDVGIATQNLYLRLHRTGPGLLAVAGFAEAPLCRLAALPETELPALLFPIGWRR